MKRRDFSLGFGAAMAGVGTAPLPVLAQAKPPVAGTDYQVLEQRAAVEAPAG